LNQQQYYGCDRAERQDFGPRLCFFSPFFFPPKKRGKKKDRMNSKNCDQQLCLSAQSIVVAEHSYSATVLLQQLRFKAIY